MSERDSNAVEYREIPGFSGYRVGSDGTVWSCWRGRNPPSMCDKWHQLAGGKHSAGYMSVALRKSAGGIKTFIIHRLVLEAFIGPRPNGMEACHFDGDKNNNAITNLRWDTKHENRVDTERLGRTPFGQKHPNSKLTAEQVSEILARIAKGEVQRALADEFKVCPQTICNLRHGRRYRTKGSTPVRDGS